MTSFCKERYPFDKVTNPILWTGEMFRGKKMQLHGLSDPASHKFSAGQLLDKAGSTPGTTEQTYTHWSRGGRKWAKNTISFERDGVNVPVKDPLTWTASSG